ncbi:MAG: hypothetical protein KJ926_06175, partial [Candidatus Omnitrophica bacterium]|nr:hypothetical protein [Candidatus Omnitrophota bacterium]
MDNIVQLLDLRIKLDQAITYGSHDDALEIAIQGLKIAREKQLASEIEYFQGQLEILNENFTKAIGHFDRAIKYNPSDGASYNDRALCMVELGIID